MEVSISAVIAQIINFWIIFWLFSKFAAKPLANAIEGRKEMLQKLKNADKAYEEKIELAKEETKKIVQDWIERKEKLILEAGVLAGQKRDEIMSDAKLQANKILELAEKKSKIMEEELEKTFVDWVKRTSLLVVKKLIKKDKEISSFYLDEAIKEFTQD